MKLDLQFKSWEYCDIFSKMEKLKGPKTLDAFWYLFLLIFWLR